MAQQITNDAKAQSGRSIWAIRALLLVILALALLLRLTGIRRAEPINYHPDDWVIGRCVLSLANDAKLALGAVHYKWPARGVIYPLGYALYALKGWCGPYTYEQVLVIQRALSALVSTAAVLAAFLLIRKLFSVRAALLAAAMLAVTHLPVQQGHFGTVTSTVSLIALLIMLLCHDLFDVAPGVEPKPSRRMRPPKRPLPPRPESTDRKAISSGALRAGRCCALGLIWGLGVSAKWTLLLGLIPIGVALLQSLRAAVKAHAAGRFAKVNAKRTAIVVAMAAAGFLAGIPEFQFVPGKVIADFAYEGQHHATGHYGEVLVEERTFQSRLGRTVDMIRRSGGVYILVAGLAAVAYCLVRRNRQSNFLLLVMLLWLAVVFRNVVGMQRHHLVPFTLMVLLLAVATDSLMSHPAKAVRWGVGGAFAFLLVSGALYTLICISPFWKPEGRAQCARWVQQNVRDRRQVEMAPRTPLWCNPEWVLREVFKSLPVGQGPVKRRYVIASVRSLNIFAKHPPLRSIVPDEWYPSSPPSSRELQLYDMMNRGGGPNLRLIKQFGAKPSFLHMDLRLFLESPDKDTSFANQAVRVYEIMANRP